MAYNSSSPTTSTPSSSTSPSPSTQRTTRTPLPRALTEFIAGSSAGLVVTLTLHPLDVLKTRLQISRSNTPSAIELVRSIRETALENLQKQKRQDSGRWTTGRETLAAFYRGLGANLAGNVGSWAVYFVLYGEAKALLARAKQNDGSSGRLTSAEFLLASGSSGVITQILTNPLWVVKTRMLSTGKEVEGAYSGLWDGCKRIVRDDGMRGLWRGLVPGMFGVLQGALQFMIYEKMKIWRGDMIADSRPPPTVVVGTGGDRGGGVVGGAGASADNNALLTNTDLLALSASSKIFASLATYPYQVIRSRLQAYDADKNYRGVNDAVIKIWRLEGLRGFYKGLMMGLVRVLPSTCITLLVYENTKSAFGG